MINASDDGPVYEDLITFGQYTLIEQLLNSSCFDEDQRASFARGIKDITQEEVQEVIDFLFLNQLDPVTHKGYYNKGDLNRHLKKLK